MKDTQTKPDFVRLRATEREPEELGLAKATCSEPEHSLADQIEETKEGLDITIGYSSPLLRHDEDEAI